MKASFAKKSQKLRSMNYPKKSVPIASCAYITYCVKTWFLKILSVSYLFVYFESRWINERREGGGGAGGQEAY